MLNTDDLGSDSLLSDCTNLAAWIGVNTDVPQQQGLSDGKMYDSRRYSNLSVGRTWFLDACACLHVSQ